MLSYIIYGVIIVLLAATLGAMKLGFNEVITGLQAIHSELVRQGSARHTAHEHDRD